MCIGTISSFCFSPTGSTRRITETIAQNMTPAEMKIMDITGPAFRKGPATAFDGNTVILAAPVYYGRVPEEARTFFASLKGEKAYAVLVVVYGNRAYEDALRELNDLAAKHDFIPIAGAAFVAEHSYSSAKLPIARGRPDEKDLMKARSFGAEVRGKLLDLAAGKATPRLSVPGNTPYVEPVNLNILKEARQHLPLTPETDTWLCSECGQCAEVCPTGAISQEDTSIIDRWQCLICFACIKNCPTGAKQMKDPNFNNGIEELYQACRERKEPEWYL